MSSHPHLILLPPRPQGHRRVVLVGSPEQSGCASAHPPPREALALLALAHYWSTLSKCCTVRKAGRPLVPHVGWHDGWPVETAGRLMARWLDITSQSAFLLSLLIRVLPFCHTFPLRSNNSQLNSHKLNSQPCCLGLSEGAHGCLPRRPPAPAVVIVVIPPSRPLPRHPYPGADGAPPTPTNRLATFRDWCRRHRTVHGSGNIGASPSCWSTCRKVRQNGRCRGDSPVTQMPTDEFFSADMFGQGLISLSLCAQHNPTIHILTYRLYSRPYLTIFCHSSLRL